MKKCELLSPAGNMEMLKYAIMYGADAVYLAGTRFGARKFAENFSLEDLKSAIEYAHLYGVKVYITTNTLIHESEVEEFIEYIKTIHQLGVDAILVQDFGMINLIHKILPNLVIHASTQMHNNSKKEVELLKSLGVERVVLDREMSIDEMSKLPKNIEKEVFIHGALCVSYSGQCLLSSYILNRSGNRGECAGLCRLPYKLEIDGKILEKPKYYLSLKDLCSIENIGNLIDLKIDSLKIEGRMKSPEYVGYITKIYRNIIDTYYETSTYQISNEQFKNIRLLFNRGLTRGYLNNFDNSNIANLISPNHIGIHLGTYKIIKNKIQLILDEDIHQHDTIRLKESNIGIKVNFLYDKKEKLINSAPKGETVYIDNFVNAEGCGEIRLVESYKLLQDIQNLPKRKVEIKGEITIQLNEPIKITVYDDYNKVTITKDKPSKSISRPITKESILNQINKTGSTIYEFTDLKINLDDGLFVNLKDLNDLRRTALEELNNRRKHVPEKIIIKEYTKNKIKKREEFNINIIVNTKEQYNIAKKYSNNIYTTNIKLYESIEKGKIFLKYPEKSDVIKTDKYIISDYGSLKNIKEKDIVNTDYMLNVTNSYTIDSLLKYNIETICLSVELSNEEISKITKNIESSRLEILIFGKIELMKMKYDIDKTSDNLAIIDRNNCRFEIKKLNGINYLMSNKPIDKIENIDLYKNIGIKNFRIDFFKENASICENILSKIYKKIYEE